MGAAVRSVPVRRVIAGSVLARFARANDVKKLDTPAERNRRTAGKIERVTLNDVILAGIERGLTVSDIRRMTLGQVVDFCIDYNKRQETAEEQAKRKPRPKKRKATQADIDSFFGG